MKYFALACSVTGGDHGAGMVELIDQLLAPDLSQLEPQLTRHQILLGTRPEGEEVYLRP